MKMKLSKTSWLILIVGILAVAFGTLGVARANQMQEQEKLSDELSVAEMRLSNMQLDELRSQKSELEMQLDQTVSQLETAKDSLRQSIESIKETDAIFDIAEACGVEIMDISSSELGSDTVEGLECALIRLTMRVEGDVRNIINFVIKLNEDFITGAVESVQIGMEEGAGGAMGEEAEIEEEGAEVEEAGTGAEIEEGADRPSANIRLTVYDYRGE